MLCLRHAMNAPFSSPPMRAWEFLPPRKMLFSLAEAERFSILRPQSTQDRQSLSSDERPRLEQKKGAPPLSFTASTGWHAPEIAGCMNILFLVFMRTPAHRKQVEGELVHALGLIVQPRDFEQFLSEFARFHLEQIKCGV